MTARAVPGHLQALRTQSRPPMWVLLLQLLEPSPTPLQVYLAGSWHSELSLELRPSGGCGHSKQPLITAPNAHLHCRIPKTLGCGGCHSSHFKDQKTKAKQVTRVLEGQRQDYTPSLTQNQSLGNP